MRTRRSFRDGPWAGARAQSSSRSCAPSEVIGPARELVVLDDRLQAPEAVYTCPDFANNTRDAQAPTRIARLSGKKMYNEYDWMPENAGYSGLGPEGDWSCLQPSQWRRGAALLPPQQQQVHSALPWSPTPLTPSPLRPRRCLVRRSTRTPRRARSSNPGFRVPGHSLWCRDRKLGPTRTMRALLNANSGSDPYSPLWVRTMAGAPLGIFALPRSPVD